MPSNYVKMVTPGVGGQLGMNRGLIVYDRAHRTARTRVPCPWVHAWPPTSALLPVPMWVRPYHLPSCEPLVSPA